MRVLGISAFYHDSAAALIEDGRILAAAQEERFTRRRFDSGFPEHAIRFCLGARRLSDIDQVIFYDKPFEKFDRILETYLAFAPRGFRTFKNSLPIWLKEKLFLKKYLFDKLSRIDPEFDRSRLRFCDHHLSHAASAFYPSPFKDAVVLVLDGVGEWATASVYLGEDNRLKPIRELRFPHSLGLLYSAFTAYCGFRVNSGEYKLMGLAPYGKPTYVEKIKKEMVRIADDGSFRLNLDYLSFCTDMKMYSKKFEDLLGGPARAPESEGMDDRYKDAACSIQRVTEEILLKMTRALAREFRPRQLCLAGGVALNCVANGVLLKDGAFEKIWIQPAAGDAGGALGAALYAYFAETGAGRVPCDAMNGGYLGIEFGDDEIEKTLRQAGARYRRVHSVADETAKLLAEGRVLAWFQGRAEFGPRALGSRSILADPRSPDMRSSLNRKIKFRESFRPFAPIVAREHLEEYFDLDDDSPYMLLVARAKSDGLPAVTHVDGSARVQTVHATTNPLLHAVLKGFHARTGCPVLVNTSFNVRGEPIVNSPAEAWRCFMGTNLDALIIGGFVLLKEEQDAGHAREYHHTLERD